MSMEELQDYCKTLFSDQKFIDMFIKFAQDSKNSKLLQMAPMKEDGGLIDDKPAGK